MATAPPITTSRGSDAAGLAGGASYTGDGADGRNLTVPGFRPDLLFLARASAAPVFRTRSMSGDLTFPTGSQAGIANSIQSTRPQGFQVGNDLTANETGRLYHVAGLRDALGADVGVTLTANTTTPSIGDTLIYTARATNYGPQPATGITLLDPLPAQLSWISAVPSQGVFDTTSGVWNAGSLANGAFATLVMRGRVKPGTAGATLIARSNRTGSSPTDAFADDDADSVIATVQFADLDVSTSVEDVTPTEGEVVVYTVRLDNLGPNVAAGVAISSSLPAGIGYLSASATSGTYTPGTGLWSIPSINNAASATLTLRGTVAGEQRVRAPKLVTRVVATNQFDPVAGNNADSVDRLVRAPLARVVTGTYVGNGAATRVVPGVGFQPDLVLIKGAATGAVLRTKSMSGDAAKDLSGSAALVTGRIRSVDGDGFTLGSDPSVNQIGVTYHWTAVLEATGQVRTGSYQAMASTIATGGARVSSRLCDRGRRCHSSRGAALRRRSGGREPALHLEHRAHRSVQALQADGFQLGASADVNASRRHLPLHRVGRQRRSRRQRKLHRRRRRQSQPHGNGLPTDLLFLARASAAPVFRTRSMSGDLTFPTGSQAGIANSIQSTRPQGFQVGNDAHRQRDRPPLPRRRPARCARRGHRSDPHRQYHDAQHRRHADFYTARATNYGPQPATGITLLDPWCRRSSPWISAVPSQGVFDTTSGVWNAGIARQWRLRDAWVMRGRVKPRDRGGEA